MRYTKIIFPLLLAVFGLQTGCSLVSQPTVAPSGQQNEDGVNSLSSTAPRPETATSEASRILIDSTSTPRLGIETIAAPTPTLSFDDHTANNSDGGDADVIFVSARLSETGTWTFAVTIMHPDTGWDDYADGWDVVLPDGKVLKPDPDSPFTRLLLHPHENEQPFTRSQGNIQIPEDNKMVTVRAHDIVDGFGGQEIVVDLTADSGPNYEVLR